MISGNARAGEAKTFWCIEAQSKFDLAGESVLAQCVDGERDTGASADIDARWRDPQRKIRLRWMKLQPVIVVRAAFLLRVGEVNEVRTGRWQGDLEIRVGVVRGEAGTLVFVIVVERDVFAGRIGK